MKKYNPPRDPKTGLGETNINITNEEILPKEMSLIRSTGVENNRRCRSKP
jgi:hypothetical protein